MLHSRSQNLPDIVRSYGSYGRANNTKKSELVLNFNKNSGWTGTTNLSLVGTLNSKFNGGNNVKSLFLLKLIPTKDRNKGSRYFYFCRYSDDYTKVNNSDSGIWLATFQH